MKKILSGLLVITFLTGVLAWAKDEAINTENGESESIEVPTEKSDKKDKQPTSADLVKQHNKIEKLEYSKKLKQRELDYLKQKLEEKKQELEKFDNQSESTKEEKGEQE